MLVRIHDRQVDVFGGNGEHASARVAECRTVAPHESLPRYGGDGGRAPRRQEEHHPVAAVDAPAGAGRELLTPTIHRYCVSHTKPLLAESWYDDCISLGDFESDSPSHVSQLDPFWHEARPIAYSAAGTYVVPIAIERFSSTANFIEISSYRKRILPSPEGAESRTFGYPGMREFRFEHLEKQAELSVFEPHADLGFLVAQPVYFENSIVGQYAASHHRKDILDYTDLAVELGVLESSSAAEFLGAKHFIPGGAELGIYPKPWIIDTLSNLELIGRQFLNRYRDRIRKYDDYQVRAVGFLSERLGSFLLLRHLVEVFSNKIPLDIFGYMTVIVEGGLGYSIASTDQSRRWLSRYLRRSGRLQ